jgi:hypothetical protein
MIYRPEIIYSPGKNYSVTIITLLFLIQISGGFLTFFDFEDIVEMRDETIVRFSTVSIFQATNRALGRTRRRWQMNQNGP